MEFQLVVSDIDGTILSNDYTLDEGMPATVAALSQSGISFALNSARSPEGMLAIIDQLQAYDSPISCFNGALILARYAKENPEVMYSLPVDREDLDYLLAIVQEQFPGLAINLYATTKWYVEAVTDNIEIEIARTGIQPTVTPLEDVLADKNRAIHKLLLIGDAKQLDELTQSVDSQLLPHTILYRAKPNYLEVTHSDVSKGHAVEVIANKLGIDLGQTFTIGDNHNDSSMLDVAGFGVAMGHAKDDVKRVADAVTETNENQGASSAIQKYVIRKDD